MGMDLMGETTGGYFRFSTVGWRKVLTLAKLYGWQPVGTEKPKLRPIWDSNYITNSGQLVTQADALALSVALQWALDDVPDQLDIVKMVELNTDNYPLYKAAMEAIEAETGEKCVSVKGYDPNLTPFEFFGGDDKHRLIEFIRFCQHGGFRIW
jgi:hypothetical protein